MHQIQQLIAWLTTGGPDCCGVSYVEARKRLQAEFGIKASPSALHLFYKRHRKPKEFAPQSSFDPATGTLTIVIKLSR